MKRTIEMVLMTLLIVLVAVFVGSTLMSCSSDDDEIIGNEEMLLGTWLLVDIENGPGSLGGGQQTWKEDIPSMYVIEFRSDGTMSFPEECLTTPALHHYTFSLPEDMNNNITELPLVFIDEVPFGYAFEADKLKLHYKGVYTCDHIPATFVFERLFVKIFD
jgi:hypothetical protein